MSKPFEHTDKIHGASLEILSGLSALNMEPRPKTNQTPEEKERGWLPDVDEMVEHAMEHFHAAFECLCGQREAKAVYREVYYRFKLHPQGFEKWLEVRCQFEDL